MTEPLSPKAQKCQDFLSSFGLDCRVVELPQSTKTSAEAAKAVNCLVEQIAKSLVFKTSQSQKPVLVIASGANRVDEEKIESLIGEPIEKATADFVKEKTGFVIGGVPPAGHLEKIETFIDQDLFQYPEIWAAAGTPNAVFKLTPKELLKISCGRVIQIK